MRRRILAVAGALLMTACVCGCAGAEVSGGDGTGGTDREDYVTRTFADTSDVLINPGKGFVYYGGPYEELKELSYIYAVGYHRFSWSDLEPEDNMFDFSKLEDSWLHYFQKVGRKFAFGVMSVNTSSTKEYITPKFVFDESGQWDVHTFEDGGVQYIPKWDDEVYLDQAAEFAAELGRRYNGSDDIAFVDILTYGNWGEQHMFGIETGDEDYSESGKVAPELFRDRYIRPYIEAFPDTLLYNTWGYDDLNGVYRELMEEGVSVRRNGIVTYTNGLDMLAEAYGKLPVAFEFARSYSHYVESPNYGKEGFNRRLEEAFAAAKPSYIELDVDWYRDNVEYCEELANRMGYYFRLKRASYPERLEEGKAYPVDFTFRNDGVAPVYEPCTVRLALLDGDGNAVETFRTDISPRSWEPGADFAESASIKAERAGRYRLAVGLFRKETDGEPCYLLGSEGRLGETKWYVLGEVAVE